MSKKQEKILAKTFLIGFVTGAFSLLITQESGISGIIVGVLLSSVFFISLMATDHE